MIGAPRASLAACLAALLAAGLALAAPPPPTSTASEAPAADLIQSARTLLREDLFEDALAAAGSAVARSPESAEAHVVMADALYRRGDFDAAGEHYRRAAALDPNCAGAPFGIGRILRTEGRYAEAAESFARAAALAPDVPKHLRLLANHLALRKDVIAMLRRYLEMARAPKNPADAEDEPTVRNVEAYLALLQSVGEMPLSEMIRAEPCSVPLHVNHGQAYVKLRIGEVDKQRFVFDTGSTGLTISPRLAARARLKAIKPFSITATPAARLETGSLVLVPELALGEGIVVRNVPATVREPAGPEEGLVGPSLLAALDITIDMRKGRLTLDKPDGPPRAGTLVPFRNVGGQIVAVAQVNDIPLNAMIDTGSVATIISRSAVARVPGLSAVPPAFAPGVSAGAGGPPDRRAILTGRLALGPGRWPADGLASRDLKGFSRALESEIYVLMGAPQLDDFVLTISYRRMTLTFAGRG